MVAVCGTAKQVAEKPPGMGVLEHFSEAGAKARVFKIRLLRHDKTGCGKTPGMGVFGHFSEAGAKALPFIISGLRHD
jgi:hypothetical protein